MGEVYRARDTELNRAVALKVLPAAFAADADRVMRFEREAKTLAALNHPNIAVIYGLERSASTGSGQAATTALVMELVEGQDLNELIARGPIAPADALPIAKQIAETLEAAHEQGIIHRDCLAVRLVTFGYERSLDDSRFLVPRPASALSDIVDRAMGEGARQEVEVCLSTLAACGSRTSFTSFTSRR
jgi:hypothetical protein